MLEAITRINDRHAKMKENRNTGTRKTYSAKLVGPNRWKYNRERKRERKKAKLMAHKSNKELMARKCVIRYLDKKATYILI